MAVPKAAKPLQAGAPAGARRCDQSAVFPNSRIPSTRKAMPPIFSTVSTDCTRPPSATVKQFTSENSRIAPTATSCRGPSCQSIAWPSSVSSRSATRR